jgi:2-(1,2-epoxy-1,2-dihydrophenyl)acetyl-CoA isomerase
MEPQLLASVSGGVGTLTFNRPAQRNAMSAEMMELLHENLKTMAADSAVRCVVLTGAGGNFVAGGDIKSWSRLQGLSPEERGADFKAHLNAVFPTIELLDSMPKPVIVALRGHAAGAGLSFVVSADFVIADQTARFHFANIRAALVPDLGLTYYLPRLVGERRALQLCLSGSQLDAAEAQSIGLADEVVSAAALDQSVAALTEKIAAAPVRAAAETKKLLRLSRHATLQCQFAAERDALATCAGEEDFLEAVTAFAERRAPAFDRRES